MHFTSRSREVRGEGEGNLRWPGNCCGQNSADGDDDDNETNGDEGW